MCGRFFVDAKNREIDRLLEGLAPDSPLPKTGEIFPSNNALVLANSAPCVMQWGFPRHDGKGLIINARAESALQKPMFAQALRKNPLAIPTSGFYEWRAGQNGKEKFLFHGQQPLLWLAGFWNTFKNKDGLIEPRFTILTTAANASVRPWHERMPLLLGAEQLEQWLAGTNIQNIIGQIPMSVQAQLVDAGG